MSTFTITDKVVYTINKSDEEVTVTLVDGTVTAAWIGEVQNMPVEMIWDTEYLADIFDRWPVAVFRVLVPMLGKAYRMHLLDENPV